MKILITSERLDELKWNFWEKYSLLKSKNSQETELYLLSRKSIFGKNCRGKEVCGIM